MAAADLQAMQQVIYGLLRDTGRRPGEIVRLEGRLCRGDRRPAESRLRQPQGRAQRAGCRSRARPPRTFSPGSATGPNGWATGHPTLVVPDSAAQGRQSLGHITRVASPGRSGSGWRRSGPLTARCSARRGACSIRRSLIFPYALRHSTPNATPMPEFRRRAEGVDGPPLRPNHYGLLPDQPEEEAAGDPGGGLAHPRRLRQTCPFHEPLAWERVPVCALRELHRAFEHQSRRQLVPAPVPVRRMWLLPTGSLIPARHRRACGQPASGLETARAIGVADYVKAISSPRSTPAPRWPRQ